MAPLPPMGWNSWNKFGCNINEELISETADAMVSQRHARRRLPVREHRRLLATEHAATRRASCSPTRPLPDGIKPLADYVHAKGLKLGIYATAGTQTCARPRPAASTTRTRRADVRGLGRRLPQVRQLQRPGPDPADPAAYRRCATRSTQTGRPIVFSICDWGQYEPWTWGRHDRQPVAHHRRHQDNWASIVAILDSNVGARRRTPARATGTIPTCSRSATAA